MKISLALPSNWGLPDPLALVDLSVLAEEKGFDAIWLGEHVLNIGYIEQRIGDKPYYAPLPLLAFIAARTSRIRLGTSVLVLPNHHPATLAKFIATLDQLSGGRVILGVGVGGNQPEFEALSLPFAERGEMSNEMLEVINALFTQDRATHHGKRWNFDNVIFSPKPVQKPFPIWVGGMFDSAPSLRRAALHGQGWQPAGLTPQEFQAAAERIRKMARDAGRDPSGFSMCMSISVDYGEPLSFEAERKAMVGSEDLAEMVRYLRTWEEHGADSVLLRLNVPDVDRLRQEIERIGEGVLPLLK